MGDGCRRVDLLFHYLIQLLTICNLSWLVNRDHGSINFTCSEGDELYLIALVEIGSFERLERVERHVHFGVSTYLELSHVKVGHRLLHDRLLGVVNWTVTIIERWWSVWR